MSSELEPIVDWLMATGAPNVIVVIALLTRPSTWTNLLISAVRNRLGTAE